MKAIILAAGLGTRLRPLTNSTPKGMLPIKGKPLLEHLVNNLKEYGITDIGMNLFYLPDKITDYFGNGERFGVNLFFKREKTLLGTSGAINQFRNWLGKEDFLIIYGDNYFHLDYQDLFDKFKTTPKSIATICVQRIEDLTGKGLVIVDSQNRITSFVEKPEHPEIYRTDLVNAGIYCFKNEILKYIPEGVFSDFGKDIFPKLLGQNQILYNYVLKEPLIDIGTIEAYNSLK